MVNFALTSYHERFTTFVRLSNNIHGAVLLLDRLMATSNASLDTVEQKLTGLAPQINREGVDLVQLLLAEIGSCHDVLEQDIDY